MAKPSIYKKVSFSDLKNRTLSAPTSDENTRVDTILNKFKELFIAQHSS